MDFISKDVGQKRGSFLSPFSSADLLNGRHFVKKQQSNSGPSELLIYQMMHATIKKKGLD